MTERWRESVDKEETLFCRCGRAKMPGQVWMFIPRSKMVEIFNRGPVYYQTCVTCKNAARLAEQEKQDNAFDPGI